MMITAASMGGLTLGDSANKVLRILGNPLRSSPGDSDDFWRFPHMSVALRQGKVFMLIAESPSVGKTSAGVCVETPWSQLEQLVGHLRYNEEEAMWGSAETPSIWYEIGRPLKEGEETIDPPYATELFEVRDSNAFVRRIYVM